MAGKILSEMKISCIASDSRSGQEGYKILKDKLNFVSLEEADVIIALGGDGFMLHTLHTYIHLAKPIYGMNRGTIGFLMNRFDENDLIEKIADAKEETLFPLMMTTKTADGDQLTAIAFNEVSVIRNSKQAANIKVLVDGKERINKLMCDGILLSTPAGSTAYNLSVHGPILPLGSNLLALTPVSPFRPRRWRGALLKNSSVVELINLDPVKRPISASADFNEVTNIASLEIKEDRSRSFKILFDKEHSLEDRISSEQYVGE